MTRAGSSFLSLLAVAAALLAPGAAARAELAAEPVGTVLALPHPPQPHWVFVGDFLLRRSALFDADSGRFLGQLPAGLGVVAPLASAERGEIYLAETHYARGSRGTRTDVVTVFDARTLAAVAEVEIPPERAEIVHGVAQSALLDEGRFLVVFNYTPATSVTVVDVAARRFVGEIQTPGCHLVYATGARRFAMLCGDGSLLALELDADGREASRARSERFFDPQTDPIAEKAVRTGDRWIFVSFEGLVHAVDFSQAAPRFAEPWPLLSEADRAASWGIGGTQPLALHAASGRLYALAHRGGPHGHKRPGTHVWVYDLVARARVQTIAMRNLASAFALQTFGLPGRGAAAWLLERVLPNPGADRIAVTQDADPRLLAASSRAGTVGVYDASTGTLLRHLEQTGLAPGVLLAPWR
jgi:methylamine dehydrogenase heavy chain